jgi:hypothetical protein
MAGTHAKAVRRAQVMQRLAKRLGIEPADLNAQARGDPELALIMTLERVADAVDRQTPDKATATPDKGLAQVEQQLEAETGHDVVQTGDDPPTFVETEKPRPRVPRSLAPQRRDAGAATKEAKDAK